LEVISRKDAKERGLKRFYTGVPCKKGHTAERYVSKGGCIVCDIESTRKWQAANPEKAQKIASNWRAANSEKARESLGNWREANPERVREHRRNWRAANLEKVRENDRNWRAAHPEKVRENRRNWYYANTEKVQESNRKWKEANPEKVLEISRKSRAAHPEPSRRWRAANPEKVRERNRNRYYANTEKVLEISRKWKESNPDKVKASAHRRRARLLNAPGSHTAGDIAAQHDSQQGRCAYCKIEVGKTWHLDHVMPISRGGSNGPENLQILCPSCNLRKGAKDPTEFAKQVAQERALQSQGSQKLPLSLPPEQEQKQEESQVSYM
jgi:5-methylcytosine-specific restriction endonuclease McrA